MKTDLPEGSSGRRPERASEVALRELEVIAAEWVQRQRDRLATTG